jgi:methylmalonyl-CoA/ethylmalonyl-CoA epimerase
MITKIDHIGIAVAALEGRLPFWAESLGIDVSGMETIDAEGVKVAFLQVGSSRLELLEPTSPDSPLAKFLEKRGEGLHHLTLEVRDLPELLERLRGRKVPIIGGEGRSGAGGRPVVFLHPKATGGVLVELVPARERPPEPPRLGPGSPVLLYLRDPQEKLWGVLRQLDTTGVVLEGIDLGSFDDWVSQIERGEESVVGPSVLFVPMTRLEKMLLDRRSGDLPSLAERFQRRAGRTVQEVLGESGEPG